MTSLDTTIPSVPARVPTTTRLLFALLQHLETGSVELTTPDGVMRRFGPGGAPAPGAKATPAVLHLHDWRVAADALKGGDVGFAEGYMAGHWDTPDLTQLLTVLAANQSALERTFYGHWWTRTLLRAKHFFNANTKRQARRNILAHYDLGNDFYRLWLDATMTYSSALFEGDFNSSLPAAQQAKYARMLADLQLPAGGRILEIGCGWGGFAEAAARAGHHVTGISLSDAQTAWARARLDAAGMADRADLQLKDYRNVVGTYDGIASIEMFEAVGERHWPAYFAKIRDALEPGGRAALQVITIADRWFDSYRRGVDFIQRHIFPGGMLPSMTALRQQFDRAGLALDRAEFYGQHYAATLAEWNRRFQSAWPDLATMGFDRRFKRMWEFYLAYCEAGFRAGSIDVVQAALVRR